MTNCPYCSKAFGRISALQNHSAFCAIRHQGKYAAKNSTDELDIPPLRYVRIRRANFVNILFLRANFRANIFFCEHFS